MVVLQVYRHLPGWDYYSVLPIGTGISSFFHRWIDWENSGFRGFFTNRVWEQLLPSINFAIISDYSLGRDSYHQTWPKFSDMCPNKSETVPSAGSLVIRFVWSSGTKSFFKNILSPDVLEVNQLVDKNELNVDVSLFKFAAPDPGYSFRYNQTSK